MSMNNIGEEEALHHLYGEGGLLLYLILLPVMMKHQALLLDPNKVISLEGNILPGSTTPKF